MELYYLRIPLSEVPSQYRHKFNQPPPHIRRNSLVLA